MKQTETAKVENQPGQQDFEDLLLLLADQEGKLSRYRDRILSAHLEVFNVLLEINSEILSIIALFWYFILFSVLFDIHDLLKVFLKSLKHSQCLYP